jgi:Putative porin
MSARIAGIALGLGFFGLAPAFGQDGAATPAPALPPAWQSIFDALTLYGDFRFRAEGDWNRSGAEDRLRGRIRLRLGANYSINDDLLVGARLSTGDPQDPRDSNATLGDGFGKLELNLDRLFMTWTPEDYDPFFLTLGKFAHPFARNPIYEELVWYSDVQPEGGVIGESWRDVGPLDALRAQAGIYVFLEDTAGDVNIAVAELMASSRFTKSARTDLSAAWYGYSNAESAPAATVDDYQILDVIGAMTFDGGRSPWKASLEGISNLGVSTGDETGWAAGVSYGQMRERGDWRTSYQYQEIGNDAVFSGVSGADFLLDRNFRGHVFNLDHSLSAKSTLRLRVLQATPIDPSLSGGFDGDTLRVRLDFNVKF